MIRKKKLLQISPLKIAERPKKDKIQLPDYKSLLKLNKPKIILQDPDSDREDAQQRKKVQQKSLQLQKEYREKQRVKTPKKSALEQQMSKFSTFRMMKRSNTADSTIKSKNKSSLRKKSVKTRALQQNKLDFLFTEPIIVTNAFKQTNKKKSAPKGLKLFLSSLRFGSQELPSNDELQLGIQIDSHLQHKRPNTTFYSKSSRSILSQTRQIKTALTFQELQGLVSRRLAIDYKK